MVRYLRKRCYALLCLYVVVSDLIAGISSFAPTQPTSRIRTTPHLSASPAQINASSSNATTNDSSSLFHKTTTPATSNTTASSASTPSQLIESFSEVNILYNSRSKLSYNPNEQRFTTEPIANDRRRLLSFLSVAFVPTGVTPNYYNFMQWRIFQRFVNANLNVFGTQSLLLGLGMKTTASQLGALSAALQYVMKDALGKVTRMVWASRMGNRFDSDAKRWRMRSAFCFAAGNGLEIATYIVPGLFLVLATLANCCKQVSMLTSSSTRSSIFNAFRDASRVENLADITAKGEAQVAIVDLAGIASGVSLSRLVVGTNVQSIVAVFALLQSLEIMCVYRQLRTVQYRVLNFERMMQLMANFCDGCIIPNPEDMSRTERIFLPPRHFSRPHFAFGSLGRSKISPLELERLLHICKNERYLLVVGTNLNPPRLRRLQFWRRKNDVRECCHIVLHAEATKTDIVKSTMALVLLRRRLKSMDAATSVRSSDCYDAIENSVREASEIFGAFLRETSKRGWESPSRSMFGRVRMRADWPLLER